MGRKKLADDVRAFTMRAPADSYQQWVAAAAAKGLTLSEWIRSVLDRSARSPPAPAPARTPGTS